MNGYEARSYRTEYGAVVMWVPVLDHGVENPDEIYNEEEGFDDETL